MISIKRKKAGQLILSHDLLIEHNKKPKLALDGFTSDINLNFTPYLYNNLVNIGLLFEIEKNTQVD